MIRELEIIIASILTLIASLTNMGGNQVEYDCILENVSTTTTTITFTTTTIPDYLEIAKEIAKRKYIRYGYDCNDKAMDYCKLVHSHGYQCKVCWGRYIEDNGMKVGHAWSMVNVNGTWIHIEATGGYIIPENVLEKRYIIHHCK